MKLINYALILFLSLLSFTIAQDDDDFEFDDDDFEFDEDEFDLEGIDEFDLEDDDFDSLLEEFEIQEEEGFEEGEPRKFSIGIIAGNWMPYGRNIANKFEPGTHFGLNVQTPFGFYFGPFEIIFGAEISVAKMTGIYDQWINPNIIDYSLSNVLATASTKILFLDAKAGFGLTPSSGPDPNGESASASLLSVTVDAIFKVPVKMGPASIDLRFRAQESLGVPGQDQGTSDMISFATIINYTF